MCKPACPIKQNSPTVFKETVLPPVFGPVTINKEKSRPKCTSIGTTLSAAIRGWRPCLISIKRSSGKRGLVAFICLASIALAKIKSNSVRIRWSCSTKKLCSAVWLLKSANTLSISSCSSRSNSRISLFNLTTEFGSIKSVAPVADWSCSIPWKEERYSALTGRQ